MWKIKKNAKAALGVTIFIASILVWECLIIYLSVSVVKALGATMAIIIPVVIVAMFLFIFGIFAFGDFLENYFDL